VDSSNVRAKTPNTSTATATWFVIPKAQPKDFSLNSYGFLTPFLFISALSDFSVDLMRGRMFVGQAVN